MKNLFIEQLSNTQHLAPDNKAQLHKLIAEHSDIFDLDKLSTTPFKEKHHWNKEYFNLLRNALITDFSVRLCSHLIEVKEHLQKKGIEAGFTSDKTTSATNENPTMAADLATISTSKSQYTADIHNFQPKQKLVDYIQQEDLSSVRAFLASELNDQHISIEEIVKNAHYTLKNLPAVFEKDKTSAFIDAIDTDESNWSAAYFDSQQGSLSLNFSLERFFHLVNVRETLMKKGVPAFQQINGRKAVEQSIADSTSVSSQVSKQTTQPYSSTQSKNHQQSNVFNTSQESDGHHADNRLIKVAMLVGGAILLAVSILFAIQK